MNRMNLLIDRIITRAQKTADAMIPNFPLIIDTELLETHLTKEEFIRSRIKIESENKKALAKYYNVRDFEHLRLVLFMTINSKDWPIVGTKNIQFLSNDKMYHRKLYPVLWPLFLRVKRIDYLKGLIEPQKKHKHEPDKTLKLSDLFNSNTEYEKIIALLEEKKIIHPQTLKAKTGEHFKGTKSILAGLIDDLFEKNYLSRSPSDIEKQIIIENTFTLKVSIDTIKRPQKDFLKIPSIT